MSFDETRDGAEVFGDRPLPSQEQVRAIVARAADISAQLAASDDSALPPPLRDMARTVVLMAAMLPDLFADLAEARRYRDIFYKIASDANPGYRHQTGEVYFAQSSVTGLVKIGFSTNVATRISGLEVNHGGSLRLLGKRSGTVADERALHLRFAADRQEGEWFKLSSELLAEIGKDVSK